MAALANPPNVELCAAIVEEKNLFNTKFIEFKKKFNEGNYKMPESGVEGFGPSKKPLVNRGGPTQNMIVRLHAISRGWSGKALEDEKARKLLCLYSEVFGSVDSPVAELLQEIHPPMLVSYYSSRLGRYLKFTATTLVDAQIQVKAIQEWYKGSMVQRRKINGLVDSANKWSLLQQLTAGGMGPAQANHVKLRAAVFESEKPLSASDSSAESENDAINLDNALRRAEKGKVRHRKTAAVRDLLAKQAKLRRALANVAVSLDTLCQPRRK
jgi:hypothetical protein